MCTSCKSLTHCVAGKSPIASPISTSTIRTNHYAFARTKHPSSSLMHTLMPTLLGAVENDASTLHLYHVRLGFLHCTHTDVVAVLNFTCRATCAFSQIMSSVPTRTQMSWIISCASFHTLLFLCFQMLHKVTPKICFGGYWTATELRN